MIGNDSKIIDINFSSSSMRSCYFSIVDKQTYIIYIMWIFINTTTIVLSVFFLKKIYNNVKKQMKLRLVQPLPIFYQKNMHLANPLQTKPQDNQESTKDYNVYRLKCLSSADFIQDNLNDSFVKVNLNNSYSFNRTNTLEKSHAFYFKIDRKKYQSSFSINLSRPLSSLRTKSRLIIDLRKKILQSLKIQFIVIGLFVTCLGPLFLVIVIDFNFKSFTNDIYRWLCLIAFTAPCVTPLCYFTVLVPSANKYCLCCFKIFRTGILYLFYFS